MKLGKNTQFQGAESSELSLTPAIPALKAAGIKQAKLAQKKGSENCFLLCVDTKGGKHSWPCGPSVSLDTALSELMFNENDVVCVANNSGNEFEDI